MPEIEVESKPWERQKGESRQAFEAFARYRDLGSERSIIRVAESLGKHRTVIGEWSVKWRWQIRIDAWEKHLDTIAVEELENAKRSMLKDHAEIGKGMLIVVAHDIQVLITKAKDERSKDKLLLDLDMIPKFYDTACKNERLARGEPTEIGEHKVQMPTTREVYVDPRTIDEAIRARLASRSENSPRE